MSAPERLPAVFHIEGFIRTRCDYQMVLVVDEIILRTDINDAQKEAMIQQLIEQAIHRQQQRI